MNGGLPKVIFEDNHLLVVEKPVNVPSQGDASGDPDLLTILKNDLKFRHQKPGNVFLGLVHRLDRPVGGVMVFAKTSKAAARLSAQIGDGEFKKTYLAVVHGVLNKPTGSLRHFLLKDNKTNQVVTVSGPEQGAKEALLEYEALEFKNELSLVRIKLLTGRSHQVRVQFSAIGHSLFGDQKYGSQSKPGQQIALWSMEIRFQHPTKADKLFFRSFPPTFYPWNVFDSNLTRP